MAALGVLMELGFLQELAPQLEVELSVKLAN